MSEVIVKSASALEIVAPGVVQNGRNRAKERLIDPVIPARDLGGEGEFMVLEEARGWHVTTPPHGVLWASPGANDAGSL